MDRARMGFAHRCQPMQLQQLTPTDRHWLPALTRLLQHTVDGGASVGFLAPLTADQAQAYWLDVLAGLGPQLQLFIAQHNGQLLGTVQLALCAKANGRHRGEVQKLMVAPASRGSGIARQLMDALEAAARRDARSLLVLDTQQGSAAETVYARLGWQRAGSIPDFATSPYGELAATVFYFKRLQWPSPLPVIAHPGDQRP